MVVEDRSGRASAAKGAFLVVGGARSRAVLLTVMVTLAWSTPSAGAATGYLGGVRVSMPAALPATPNVLGPRFSVAHTYIVDTSADTNPASPATACAPGNPTTCSLRAAIAAANTDAGNIDAVSVPAGMVITLSSTFGGLVLSNSMFIDATGATVNGGGDIEIFDEESAAAVVQITGLELTNGNASDGGAVRLGSGSLVLSGVDVTANAASTAGAGVYQLSGQLWVDGSTFANNSAPEGAGVYTTGGSAQIEATTFGGSSSGTGNVAAAGAGIYNVGADVIVNDCTFDFNHSGPGALGTGVDVFNNAVMDLTNSAFDHTSSSGGGAGVDVYAAESTDLAEVTIDNTSVTGSGNVQGGAIYADGFTTDLINVSVDHTSVPVAGASIEGGAVFLKSTEVTWDGGSVANTTDGGATNNDTTEGGALYADSSNAIVTGVAISHTTTEADGDSVEGGAIYNSGTATYHGVSISGTSSLGVEIYGGAVYNTSEMALDNLQISKTITHSSGPSGSGIEGGVLYNSDYLSIDNVTSDHATVTADLASTPTPSTNVTDVEGGDIYNSDYVDADGLSFTNTTVNASGGDGYVEGGGLFSTDYEIINNAQVVGTSVTADHYVEGGFFYNTAYVAAQALTLGRGTVSVPGSVDSGAPYDDGAVLFTEEPTNIVNGTMTNVSSSVGANATENYGIYIINGVGAEFTNATIANDTMTGPTGKTFLVFVASGDSLSLLNTIVASKTAVTNCGLGSGGSLISVGNNLDSGSSCGFDHPGDLANTKPMVAGLANNGGPVDTAALLSGSPAIDAGTYNGCPPTDARGVSRGPGPACDIGSYEFVAAPIVSKLSPNGGPTGGGTVVTITGSNLAGATAVDFGASPAHIDKTVSPSEIEVTSPVGSGTVDVTVTTAGGTSVKSVADHYTY